MYPINHVFVFNVITTYATWEVRTKVICDTLTSMVFASKPTLEQSFDNTADVLIASDEASKSHREVSYNLIVTYLL